MYGASDCTPGLCITYVYTRVNARSNISLMCGSLALLASLYLESCNQFLYAPRCYIRCSEYWNSWSCVLLLGSHIVPQFVIVLTLQFLLFLLLVTTTSHVLVHVTLRYMHFYNYRGKYCLEQEVEASRFKDSWRMKVIRLSTIRTGHLNPPINIPGTYFF
jgi:hypothetical protein